MQNIYNFQASFLHALPCITAYNDSYDATILKIHREITGSVTQTSHSQTIVIQIRATQTSVAQTSVVQATVVQAGVVHTVHPFPHRDVWRYHYYYFI